MKLRMPGPDTMDKIILGVAVAGVAVIIATVHAIPEPDAIKEHARHVLDDLKDLNAMTAGAVYRGDYELACQLQKTTVDLMLKTYPLVDDATLDLGHLLERDLCAKAEQTKEFI